ncbi:MAG TPA: O-antigen ligase family protein [bacterium]|nr:O-antigen ligase family protein [bacterium]
MTRRLTENTLLLAVFFTPLLFFTSTHDQFELPKLLFMALLLSAFLFLTLLRPLDPGPGPRDGLSLSLLAFFLTQLAASLPAFSLSWTTSLLGDYENFAGLATLAVYLGWYFLLTRLLNAALIEKSLFFFLLAGLLSALYALAQHFGFDFIQWNSQTVISGREFASLGNPNFLAAYLAMLLPVGLWFLTGRKNLSPAPSRWFPLFSALAGLGLLFLAGPLGQSLFQVNSASSFPLWFLVPGLGLLGWSLSRFLTAPPSWTGFFFLWVLVLGLLTTASRGGFLAALAGLALFLALVFRQSGGGIPWAREHFAFLWRPRAVLFLGLALAALFFFGASFFPRLLASILHLGDSLATSRLHIWRPALRMIAANPLQGVGLDTFKIAFPYYSGIEFNQIDGMFMSSRTAHNELIQITATTGFLGLAAYLGLLFFFLASWVRAYGRSAGRTRGLLAALLACALAYQVQNLFSFGVAGINFLWFFCLAAVQRLSRGEEPAQSPAPRPSWGRKLLAGALALALAAYGLTRLSADIAFAEGNAVNELLKHHDPNADPDRLNYYSNYGIGQIQKAIRLCPWEVKYPLYLGLSYEERAKLDGAHEADWLLKAQDYYLKAISMSPANAYYYNDLGRIEDQLALYGPKAAEMAEKAYQRAVFFAPSSPFFRLNWAQALEAIGQKNQAQAQRDQAFALDKAFSGKWMAQTALQAYQSGDKQKALGELSQAVAYDPSNAAAYFYRGLIELDDKDRPAARRDLSEAKRLNPADPQIDKFLSEAEGKK